MSIQLARTSKGKFTEAEPLPCPYCGAHAAIEDGWKGGGWNFTEWNGWHWVQCQECGARGPELTTRLFARKEWDRIASRSHP